MEWIDFKPWSEDVQRELAALAQLPETEDATRESTEADERHQRMVELLRSLPAIGPLSDFADA